MSCRPKGIWYRECWKSGKAIPGTPVKLAITVYISAIYIDIGSVIFSPILKATEGAVGIQIKSKSLKINVNLFVKSFLTFCA